MSHLIPTDALYRKLATKTENLAADRPPPRYLFLSGNSKTGVSVNVSMAGSCQPTPACMRYCYGVSGPIAMDASVARQVDNLNVLRDLADATQARVDAVALALALDVDRAGRSWFRWHGVGDLLPGTVRVINAIAQLRPDLVQWVVTRKPAEAAMLEDLPSIRLLVSLDATTPESRAAALLALRGRFTRARVRVAWVRQGETLAPAYADIVFNQHRNGRKLAVIASDVRTCDATEVGGEHKDACDRCRRCFAD